MFSGKLSSFALNRFFLENALWDNDSDVNYQLNFGTNVTQELSDLLKDWTKSSGYTAEFIYYPTANADVSIPNLNEISGVGNFEARTTPNPFSTSPWAFGLTRSLGETDYKIGFNYRVSGPATKRIQTEPNIISPNEWHRLALVIEPSGDDRIVSIYLDGIRKDITDQPVDPFDPPVYSPTITIPAAEIANVIIGGTSVPMSLGGTSIVGSTTKLRGYVDELRLSNTVRYSGSNYNISEFPFVNDANTISLLHFNGTAESTTFNDSGQFNFLINNKDNNVIICDDRENLEP
jgi:hypothetical protein